MEVVDVDAVDLGAEADRVGRAVDGAPLDAAAGQPHGEAVRVVVAALALLRHRHPAELAAPDDQRLVEQPAPLQVGQQAGDRLVGPARTCAAWFVSTSSWASQPLTSPE